MSDSIKQIEHPSGKYTLVFDPDTHSYVVDQTGQKLTSVTTHIEKFFPKFETDAVAKKCAGRKRYKGMTAAEIKSAWAKEKERGMTEGTNIHEHAELLLMGWPANEPQSEREEKIFEQVVRAILALEERFQFEYTEKIIFSPELGLAGMIDLEMWDPATNEIVLLDWKQNKEIKKSNPWENAKSPISHMEACDWNKYQLQLNLYEYISWREGYWTEGITGCRKALIHLTEDHFYSMKVSNLQSEIVQMVDEIPL